MKNTEVLASWVALPTGLDTNFAYAADDLNRRTAGAQRYNLNTTPFRNTTIPSLLIADVCYGTPTNEINTVLGY
jgi:hypothetical protein